jgi:hypothetical protein
MYELKTKLNDASVLDFINTVDETQKKSDAYEIIDMMKEISGQEPKMWGGSIVGFGSYHYKYKSGNEGDWMKIGFSPRKQALTLYLSCDLSQHEATLQKLGKYKTGKGCLYIRKLTDVDMNVLKVLIEEGYNKAQ